MCTEHSTKINYLIPILMHFFCLLINLCALRFLKEQINNRNVERKFNYFTWLYLKCFNVSMKYLKRRFLKYSDYCLLPVH